MGKNRHDVIGDAQIVAVDFDGTLCEAKWPEIGEPKWQMINYIKSYKDTEDKVILWTSRSGEQLEEAVAWCEEKGLIFDAVNDNIPEMTELFGFNSRKVFADIYIDDKNRTPWAMYPMDDMGRWAKHEIDLAEKKDNDGFWSEYTSRCYRSALQVFTSLCGDGHSGMSINVTKAILNRLIDHKPLTPIEDIPDEWDELTDHWTNGDRKFQSKRMSSLFKTIAHGGVVSYSDNDRVICVDINDNDISYTLGLVTKLVDKRFPIKMPYMPDSEPIKVYCEEFLTDVANGSFDTVGVMSLRLPDEDEDRPFYRYFKSDVRDTRWVEIDRDEYYDRWKRRIKKDDTDR